MIKPGTLNRFLRLYCMINVKNILKLTVAALLISGPAYASETQDPVVPESAVDTSQKVEFVFIPLDTNFKIKKLPQLNRELSDEYETDYISKIEYDLLGNMEADLGVVKTKNVKSRYRVRSGALPRGHYFKPVNSKLGAKLSTKF